MNRRKKILFFHDGPHPSDELTAKCRELGATMRNTRYVRPGDKVEVCDAVCGIKIPEDYREFPRISLNDPAGGVKAAEAPIGNDPEPEPKPEPKTKA